MSIVQTFRRYTSQLTSGIDFLRSALGVAYSGTIAVVHDALAEGALQGFYSGLPQHPQQAPDSLDQVGSDRGGLYRFRTESQASWAGRVRNAWQSYEQAGTPVQMLRAVNEWGAIIFPATWNPANVALTDGTWARFVVWLSAGLTSWQSGDTYGTPDYGADNVLYGLSNAVTEDVDTLTRILQKWKPSRSKGKVIVVITGIAYDQPAITYNTGQVYGGTFAAAQIQAP